MRCAGAAEPNEHWSAARPGRAGGAHDAALRLYLEDLRALPGLSREEEYAAAIRVEQNRARFVRTVLATDTALASVLELIDQVVGGRLRLDRVVSVAPRDHAKKREIRLGLQLSSKALPRVLQQNRRDFRTAADRSLPAEDRRAARRRISARRKKAARLIERLCLRTAVIHDLWEKLYGICRRASLLDRQRRREERGGARDRTLQRRLQRLTRLTRESPANLERLRRRAALFEQRYAQAKRELAAANLRLVVYIARRYRQRGVPFLDLIQEGNCGLMFAAEKFEPLRGHRFASYAGWWIHELMRRAVVLQKGGVRPPLWTAGAGQRRRQAERRLPQELGRKPSMEEMDRAAGLSPTELPELRMNNRPAVSSGDSDASEPSGWDTIEDFRHCSPPEAAHRRLLHEDLSRAVLLLGARSAEVIQRRWGLNGYPPHTRRQIASRLSLSQERVRQLELESLARLRRILSRCADAV